MATCGPKRILHTKLGVRTADVTVGNLRLVASRRGGGLYYISFNFHESLSVEIICSILNSIIFS